MKKIYGIDLRSLAAFRIVLSLFIAIEFFFRVLGNFNDVYSPSTGILGNSYASEYQTAYNTFGGIFSIQADSIMQLVIWLIIVTMILLATGFYPRIMAITGCILLSNFFNRYSLLYFGWEMYASAMLFWLTFVPNNSCYSLFNIGEPQADHSSEWRSPLTYALLFQIGIIYFYNGISKNGELWMSGDAIESFLSDTDKAKPLANWLSQQHFLCTVLTYFTLFTEIGLIVLLFSPWKSKQLRYFAVILILLLHWGIAIFVDVGNFKYLV